MLIEVLNGLERRVHFSVKKNAIQSIVKIELKKYAKKSKIQGFRPGKVPFNVIEKMYGAKVYEDTLNDYTNKEFVDIITKNKLELASHPKFDLTSGEGEEFVFAAVFEITPEVKIGNLSTQSVIKPTYTVTDDIVQKTIDKLRQQRATYNEEDKIAQPSDSVTIDFIGTVDGLEFDGGKAEGYQFILGQNTMLPDFEAGVIGLTAGQSRETTVLFPSDYPALNLRDKTAVFTIRLNSVAKQQLPALTDDFAKTIGIDAIANLVTVIKANLEQEVKRILRAKLRTNALNALALATPIDAPRAMVHDEIHNMMKNTEERMKADGYAPERINLTHEMFALDAKSLVTMRLLVREYVKENAISVNAEEIKAVIFDIAATYEDPVKYIDWYYQDQVRIDEAKAIAMENKVIDSLLTKVRVEEKEISYEELMRK